MLRSCIVLGPGEGQVYKEEGVWGGKSLPTPYPGVGGQGKGSSATLVRAATGTYTRTGAG